MATTPNYSLYKPDRTDNTTEVDTSLSGNFTTIDTQMKTNSNAITTHTTNPFSAHNATAITYKDTTVDAELTGLDSRVTTIETNGVGGGTIPADLDTRLTNVETTNTTQDDRLTDVENNVDGMLAPTTFDELANQTFNYDELRFGYVDNKLIPINAELDDHTSQLAEIAYNVKNYGAKGDGVTDDTIAIQNALNTASSNGGQVFFPDGKYVISSITIPEGVSIVGVYAFNPDKVRGSWLYCTGTVNPAITLVNNNQVQGFGFFYPNQSWDTTNSKPLIAYPSTFYIQTDATKITIRDIFFQNTYIAIDSNRHHESLTIEHINGYAIYQGIIIDYSTDIDRLSNVHFNDNAWDQTASKPANAASFYQWTRTNGTAFLIQQCDWLDMDKCFAWGYRYGIVLQDSTLNLTNKSPSGVNIRGCGFDQCGCDIWQKSGWGIQISDCFFTAYNKANAGQNNSTAAVLIDGGQDVTITNCRWWGTEVACISLACENGIVENCKFWEYGLLASSSNNVRAILLWSGNHQIANNLFNGKSKAYVFGIIINSTSVIASIHHNTFRDFVQSVINTIDNAGNFIIERCVFKNVVPALGAAKVFLGATQTNYQYDSTKDLVVA